MNQEENNNQINSENGNSTKTAVIKSVCLHDWSEIDDMVFMCDKCGEID